MAYVREQIHGTSGQDINKMNENFMNIFSKVFGDINFSDTDKRTQNKINTQWIPIQGEGNLDASNPLYIRFFVPPNTTTVKSSNFNVMTEHYRMDSSITSSAESKQEVVSIVSSASPSSNQTSTTQPEQTQTSSTQPEKTQTSSTVPQQTPTATTTTVGVSSVSNATVGVSSVGGGGATSLSGGGSVRYVRKWGTSPYEYNAPTQYVNSNATMTRINGGWFYEQGRDDMATQPLFCKYGGQTVDMVDMAYFQHSHEIPAHTHGVPNHSHSISLGGHSHSISMSPHNHTITIPSHNHTISVPSHNHTITTPPHSHTVNIPSHSHTVNGSVTIPSHSHTLNEGIKISGTSPSNVRFNINDVGFATINGSNAQNNIDITQHVKIGAWNTIKVTSSTVARAVLYGTIELLIK